MVKYISDHLSKCLWLYLNVSCSSMTSRSEEIEAWSWLPPRRRLVTNQDVITQQRLAYQTMIC